MEDEGMQRNRTRQEMLVCWIFFPCLLSISFLYSEVDFMYIYFLIPPTPSLNSIP